jgi:hypothetical protein
MAPSFFVILHHKSAKFTENSPYLLDILSSMNRYYAQ